MQVDLACVNISTLASATNRQLLEDQLNTVVRWNREVDEC